MSTPTQNPHRIVAGDEFGWKPDALPFDTIPKLFRQRVQQHGNATMMRQKDLGLWKAYSWNEVAAIADQIGAIAPPGGGRLDLADILHLQQPTGLLLLGFTTQSQPLAF